MFSNQVEILRYLYYFCNIHLSTGTMTFAWKDQNNINILTSLSTLGTVQAQTWVEGK